MTGIVGISYFKIITDPSFLADNIYFNHKDFLNMERPNIGYLLLLFLIIFLFLKKFIHHLYSLQSKVVNSVLYNIRSMFFNNYLSQDYSFFVKNTLTND